MAAALGLARAADTLEETLRRRLVRRGLQTAQAGVRRTALALATAIHAEQRGWEEVRLASFDEAVLRAHAELHPDDAG